MKTLPEYWTPPPMNLLKKAPDSEEGKQGDRWIRSLTMLRNEPPTENYPNSGYVVVAILDEQMPTGVFKVGIHPKWSQEELRDDCECCEQDWHWYLKALENEFGSPVILKPYKPPYHVNLVERTCDCPDFMNRGLECKHLMLVLAMWNHPNKRVSKSGRVIITGK